MVYQAARLPANPDKDKCACGSGLSYGRCCRSLLLPAAPWPCPVADLFSLVRLLMISSPPLPVPSLPCIITPPYVWHNTASGTSGGRDPSTPSF